MLARAQRGQQSATLGESVVARTVEGAQDHRAGPSGGQGDRVGVHRVDIAHPGQDQRRGCDVAGHRFRGGRGGSGEQRGHGGDPALGGGEYGCPRAHPVAGQRQAFGMHGECAVAQPDPGADIEGGEQVGGQVQVGGERAAFGIRRGGHDPPRREVFEQRPVVTGVAEPAVPERDRG